jgi:hypothetical protein
MQNSKVTVAGCWWPIGMCCSKAHVAFIVRYRSQQYSLVRNKQKTATTLSVQLFPCLPLAV